MSFFSDALAQTTSAIPIEQLNDQVNPTNFIAQNVMFLFLLFAVFYFILIRPQQKRIRAHQDMVKSLDKGARVLTSGGIIGKVVKLEGDDVVLVEIAPSVQVRVARSTIQEIVKDNLVTANDN